MPPALPYELNNIGYRTDEMSKLHIKNMVLILVVLQCFDSMQRFVFNQVILSNIRPMNRLIWGKHYSTLHFQYKHPVLLTLSLVTIAMVYYTDMTTQRHVTGVEFIYR